MFKKELSAILSGFHSVVSELEGFASRVEKLASKKQQQATQLTSEVQAHLDEVAHAKAVAANIKILVTPSTNTP